MTRCVVLLAAILQFAAPSWAEPITLTELHDAAPPDPAIASGPTSPTNQTSATFVFSDPEGEVSLLCQLDGAGFTPCDSSTGQSYPGPLAAGAHLFSLQAQDASGNLSSAVAYSWTIDLTAPDVAIDSKPDDLTSHANATFAFHASDATAFTLACKLDGGVAETPCASPKNYSSLTDGTHTFTVTATDAAGNASSDGFTWTIDSTAPDPMLDTRPSDPSASNTATFAFHAAGAGTVALTCQLDGAVPETPCASPKTYSGLADGSHTFRLTAVDGAGNASSGSFGWVVDTTPPTVTFGTRSPAPNGNGWNNTDVSVAFTIHDTGSGVDAANGTANPLVLSAEGVAVTGTVTATDNAGNGASATSPAVKIDKTPPTVSIATPADGAAFTQRQSVTAGYSCSDGLSGVGTCVGSVASGSKIDTASIGPKSFTVTATDKAGNTASRSLSYSVNPPPGAEHIHPNAHGWVAGYRTGPAACEWQFSHALASYAQCKLQCARNSPAPCGTTCETQFGRALNRLSQCPPCLSAAAMDAARQQYADAAASWNGLIYSRRPAPGKMTCEGRWSQALDALLWNMNTEHLQRAIGEIKTAADVLKAELHDLAEYKAKIDRLSSCPAGYSQDDALEVGTLVQAFLDAATPLPFCDAERR